MRPSRASTVTRYNKKYLVSMCLQEHSWMCVIQTQTSYMCFCIMSRPVVLACGDVLSGSMCTYMVHWWVSAALPVCWSLHQNEWNMTGTALLSGPFTLMMYSIVAWAVFVWRGWTGSLTFSSRRLWYKYEFVFDSMIAQIEIPTPLCSTVGVRCLCWHAVMRYRHFGLFWL